MLQQIRQSEDGPKEWGSRSRPKLPSFRNHAALARAIVEDTSDALMARAVTSSSRRARSAGHSFESLSWDRRPGEMPSCAARSD